MRAPRSLRRLGPRPFVATAAAGGVLAASAYGWVSAGAANAADAAVSAAPVVAGTVPQTTGADIALTSVSDQQVMLGSAAAQAKGAADKAAAEKAAADAAAAEQAAAAARQAQADAAARDAQRQSALANAVNDPRSVAKGMLASYGWSASQFSCLDSLWTKESGWNFKAQNGSSGAYGIPQSLPGSKMGTVAADWRTNPVTQITWGLGYIQRSYGSPCSAWAHSQAVNWY